MTKWRLPLVLCAAVMLLAGSCAALILRETRQNAHQLTAVRGVHYWGNASPTNFWNGTDPSLWDRDFDQVRAEGFNAVVIVVPWTAFQLTLGAQPRYDERNFELLERLMRTAARHDLGVILRLGYTWSFNPQAERPRDERMAALFDDDQVYRAWLAFIAETCRRVCDAPNLLFAFLSWEDINVLGPLPEGAIRRPLDEYLAAHYPLGSVEATYGKKFAGWTEVPVPDKRSPAYRYVLEYWDSVLIERFFEPALARFPKLSLELRIDKDPVWDANGQLAPYGHERTYALPGAPVLTSYYSVAWGMKNTGDQAGAQETLAKFKLALSDLREYGGSSRPIFLDQLLFDDDTPGFERLTHLRPTELNAFITGMGDILAAYRAGYALWQLTDYAANMLYNPSFQRGLAGWTPIGSPKPVRETNDETYVSLDRSSGVAQPVDSGLHAVSAGTAIQVCARARATGKESASVDILIDSTSVGTFQYPAGDGDSALMRCTSVQPHNTQFVIALVATNSPVDLDDVLVYAHVQASRLIDLEGRAQPPLAAFRTLNAGLARIGLDPTSTPIAR